MSDPLYEFERMLHTMEVTGRSTGGGVTVHRGQDRDIVVRLERGLLRKLNDVDKVEQEIQSALVDTLACYDRDARENRRPGHPRQRQVPGRVHLPRHVLAGDADPAVPGLRMGKAPLVRQVAVGLEAGGGLPQERVGHGPRPDGGRVHPAASDRRCVRAGGRVGRHEPPDRPAGGVGAGATSRSQGSRSPPIRGSQRRRSSTRTCPDPDPGASETCPAAARGSTRFTVRSSPSTRSSSGRTARETRVASRSSTGRPVTRSTTW